METNEQMLASVLHAAANPLRVLILELLSSEGILSVNDICRKIKVEQSLTSHHLKLLTKAGYITGRRKGKFIYYSIASHELLKTVSIAKAHLGI